MSLFRGRLGGGPTTVDGDDAAVDEGGFFAGQVEGEVGDFVGLAESADGLALI